jgi:hypothetical protein
MTDTILEIALPQCAAEDFDGEIVAMNLDTGMYFSIKDTAAVIWRDLAEGNSVESLVKLADGDSDFVQSIDRFVAELLDAGLMRKASARSAPQQPPGLGSAIARGAAAPLLEAFGDMQKLLLLDPVHEVDESAGWPLPKEDDDTRRL